MATIRPYRPKTSAKMRIRIIPTNSLGCWAVPRTPASPTIPMAKPAARPENPTARPAPRWMKPLRKVSGTYFELEVLSGERTWTSLSGKVVDQSRSQCHFGSHSHILMNIYCVSSNRGISMGLFESQLNRHGLRNVCCKLYAVSLHKEQLFFFVL